MLKYDYILRNIAYLQDAKDIYQIIGQQLTYVKMTSKHQNEFTSVICRNIRPGHEKDYDDWLRRYLTSESKVHGNLGTTIIIPRHTGSNLRYIIHCFTNREINGSMGKFSRIPESVRGSK